MQCGIKLIIIMIMITTPINLTNVLLNCSLSLFRDPSLLRERWVTPAVYKLMILQAHEQSL